MHAMRLVKIGMGWGMCEVHLERVFMAGGQQVWLVLPFWNEVEGQVHWVVQG